jgi:hypothetical protein
MEHKIVITDENGFIQSIDHKEGVFSMSIVELLDEMAGSGWKLLQINSFVNDKKSTRIQYTLISVC